MRPGLRAAGPVRTGLLMLTGVAGILLAVHGWGARQPAAVLGSVSHGEPSAATSSPARAAGPSAPAPATAPAGTASGAPAGPLLSSQSFASYAYPIWPARPTQAAQAALTGLSVTVHRQGTGLSVLAGVNGQQQASPHYYPLGARVYVVEAALGDDSGSSDYNLGDDGIVVTDATGRIVT